MVCPRLRIVVCSLLAASAWTGSGRADDSEAAARTMFEQASRDMDAGAYDKACPALVQVVRLTRGIGSMIKLGKCYEAASTVGFVTGGVLLAAGVTLLLVAPKRSKEPATTALSVLPMVGYSAGGLQLVGGW